MTPPQVWDILELPATHDRSAIRRAYARRLKDVHPEDDAAGFQALREAYDQAMALADQRARWRGAAEDAAEAEPDLEPDRLGVATLAEPEAPRDSFEAGPAIDTGPHWARLSRLDQMLRTGAVAADLQQTLHDLLGGPAMENIGVYAATEASLADLLAQRIPQSDPLLQQSVDAFGWRTASAPGDRTWEPRGQPQGAPRAAILQRLEILTQIRKLNDPTYTDHAAYLALMRPPPQKRSKEVVALAPSMRRLFRLVQSEAPALVHHFNPETRVWWRDYLNSDTPRRGAAHRAGPAADCGLSWR